jgi:hypothetical protein
MHLPDRFINHPPRLRSVASVIPVGTPAARLQALLARYENVDAPEIASLPAPYRSVICDHLHARLAHALAEGASR